MPDPGYRQGMTTSFAPLRDEHRELIPHIEQLRTTADRVGATPRARLVSEVQSSLDFLVRHLRPHAQVEDEVLYPEVGRLLGSSIAVETMRRDHDAIVQLTGSLQGVLSEIATTGEITRATQNDLRRLLYGLHALISVHFAKEEHVYMPLLEEQLDDRRAAELLQGMSAAHARHEGQGETEVPHGTDVIGRLLFGTDGEPPRSHEWSQSPTSDADAPAPW